VETGPKAVFAGIKSRYFQWWDALPRSSKGIAYFSVGSLGLVIMSAIVKSLGERLPPFEMLFFRSIFGFLLVIWLFRSDLKEPLRTKRPGAHFFRGFVGACGNACFFWTITHMLLADSQALQFSRPLWMVPLALCFLSEVVGFKRVAVALVGFAGILLYVRPFTEGFDYNALIGAAGGFFAALVIVAIKNLQSTEGTKVIMFYYAFWNTVFSMLPAIFTWIAPTPVEVLLLIFIGFLGIGGQALMTTGLSMGDATALAPLDYSRIVYAAIIGFLFFGEIPGLSSLAGIALIIGASMYLVISERKRSRQRPAAKTE
jgi:drug/metabolite transporter (DMT)-like permease